MSIKDLALVIMILTLTCVGTYYSYRFWKIRNDILAIEWFIIGFSALCFFLYAIGISENSIKITMFFDVFSRMIGMPIIAVLGLMKATHNLKFSLRGEVVMFSAAFIVSYLLIVVEALQPILPILFFSVGILFTIYLILFAKQLFSYRITGHGYAMIAMIVMNFFVMLLQDYMHLSHDDTAVFFNKLFIEHVVWSFSFAEMFYAYSALVKAKNISIRPTI